MVTVKFKSRGKVPNTTLNLVLNGALNVALFHKIPVAEIEAKALPYIYRLCKIAMDNMSYDDEHPMFKGVPAENTVEGIALASRPRILPFIGFNVSTDYYTNGCDDTHWRTAIYSNKETFLDAYKSNLTAIVEKENSGN